MSFLGISKTLPDNIQGLIQKFLILASFQSTFFFISGTFYVLFIIDKLGYFELGILTGVAFLVQAVFDYPSGSLGDWIGQRWVLGAAFFSFCLSYGLLVLSNTFIDFLFVYILAAFAASQESGALQAWFDNNYKNATKNGIDLDRSKYQLLQGKMNMILGLLWAFSILVGGLLATMILREFVFAIQSIGMLFLAIISIIFVKDLPDIKKPKKSFKQYFSILGGGIKYIATTKYLGLYIIGLCLLNAIWAIWGQMILFPMYFGYTGSDMGAGFFRFIAWINQSLTAGYAGRLSIKFNFKKIPWLEWAVMFGYFSFFAVIIFIFPLKDELNFLSIIIVLIAFALLDFCVNILDILRQRFYLDIIPDTIRNSIYSFIPTISLILSAPTVIIAGISIESLGIPLILCLMTIFGTFAVVIMLISFRIMPAKILETSTV